jgi:ribosome maturation factor RimP
MTPASQVDLEQLATIASPVIEGAGYELVDLEWKKELGGWILRFFIDKPGGPHPPGEGISLDGCAEVSRELGTVLDVSEALPGSDAYSLEVSSPGLDRPLKRLRDFQKVTGKKVKVRTRRPLGPPPGRRNFAGPLVAVVEPGLLTIDVGDRTCEVPITEIEKANLVFEMQNGSR